MLRFLRLIALIVFAAAIARPMAAQSTPAPPDWKDNGASVYLGATEKSLPANDVAPSIPPTAAEPEKLTTSRKFDSSVVPSAHTEQTSPVEPTGRHLPPPGTRASSESTAGSTGHAIA